MVALAGAAGLDDGSVLGVVCTTVLRSGVVGSGVVGSGVVRPGVVGSGVMLVLVDCRVVFGVLLLLVVSVGLGDPAFFAVKGTPLWAAGGALERSRAKGLAWRRDLGWSPPRALA